jgi:hypothetical protein
VNEVLTFIKLVPEDISQVLSSILDHHGRNGFVLKLKDLKIWAFQLLAGHKDFKRPWFRISKFRGYTYPTKYRCIFVPLILAIINNHYKVIQRYLTYLNIYHVVQGPMYKDRSEVTAPVYNPPPESPNPKFNRIFDLVLTFVRKRYRDRPRDGKPLASAVAVTPTRNGTYAQWLVEGAPGEPLPRPLHIFPWEIYPGETMDLAVNFPNPDLWQGNLTIIGDSGGKNRLILVGHPYVQNKLKNLQHYLLDMLRECEWDCTFNQRKGHDFIIANQLKERPLYSVDLSDATWNFPWSLQEKLLISIGAGDLVRYFKLPVSDNGAMVTVKKGQAMGLNPSFPLFSLTHGLVIYGLAKFIGVDIDSFRVLGDDIIFSNKALRDIYLEFCDEFDIPISYHKCLSGQAGEFAGKIFIHGKDVTPIKWRWLTGDSIPSLFHQYKDILGWKRTLSLVRDKDAFLVLGGLSHHAHGLGLTDFDSKFPVYARHRKIRRGLVRSLIRNIENPMLVGGELNIRQPEMKYNPLEGSDFLRTLASRLKSPCDPHPEYGFLPYLGDPVKIARQLGITVPLLPVRSKTNGWKDNIHLNFKYMKGKDDLHETVSELRRLRQEIVEESEAEAKTPEGKGSEQGSRFFFRTLEGEFGRIPRT